MLTTDLCLGQPGKHQDCARHASTLSNNNRSYHCSAFTDPPQLLRNGASRGDYKKKLVCSSANSTSTWCIYGQGRVGIVYSGFLRSS